MKIAICDVCHYERKDKTMPLDMPLVRSAYKISFKNGRGARLSLDVCDKHKNYFKGITYTEAEKKVENLYTGVLEGEQYAK